MMPLALAIGAVVLIILTLPLFVGPGGILAESSTINSPDRLEARKNQILKRYVEEEEAFARGDLSKTAWQQRRKYLVHRYIDVVKRLDFVTTRKEL